jgi:hypothetical protein
MFEDELADQLHAALAGMGPGSGGGWPGAAGGGAGTGSGGGPANGGDGAAGEAAGGGGKPGGGHAGGGEEDDAVIVPSVTDDALYCANTVFTVADYARSLYARACAEMCNVFPAHMDDATAPADSRTRGRGGDGSDEGEFARHPSPHGSAPMLRPPLMELRELTRQLAPYADAAARALASGLCADGLAQLRQALAGCSYVPANDAAFEAARAADPVLSAFHHALLHACGVLPALARLWRPQVADAVVKQIALLVASAVEEGVIGGSAGSGGAGKRKPVSDLGALLLTAQVRGMGAALQALMSAGSVRGAFARLGQACQVLAVESVPDLYTLGFPQPALSRDDVSALLRQRTGLVVTPAVLEAVQWERVPVTCRGE